MRINYYKTYLQTIRNSVGTKMFQEFYIDEQDILNKGSVACAYYVSNILKQFNLVPVGRANVLRIIDDLRQKGWKEIFPGSAAKDIPLGSVLVREAELGETYKKKHYHIGFYMGDEQAISNNSNAFESVDGNEHVPVRHHYTYDNTRAITRIFTRDRNNPFSDWLYHYELDIPVIMSTGWENLISHGLSEAEAEDRLGVKDGMENGRLCGAACVLMALHYFAPLSSANDSVSCSTCTEKKPLPSPAPLATFKDCISFANQEITYYDSKRQCEKTVTCFVKPIGRYHSGLIHMAQELGKKANLSLTGKLFSWESIMESHSDNLTNSTRGESFQTVAFLSFLQEVLRKNIAGEKNIILASVSTHFDVTQEKKGGHLVLISGIDNNSHTISIIVNDPIQKTKQLIPLSTFISSFSGNMIILTAGNN